MAATDGRIQERRRRPRHVVQNVEGTLHISADAKILNMSLTGLAVETDTQLRVGRTYSLTLRHGVDHSVRLSGTVVWCHLRSLRRSETGDTRPIYVAGVRFEQALTDRAAELARMLEATAVVAVEKRVSGRFKVNVPEPVSVAAEYHFGVKTISALGLMVETEAALALGTVIDVELHVDGATLRAKGRIAHVREVRDPGAARVSHLGIEFVETTDADRKAIEQFIADSLQPPADGADA